MVRKVLVQVTAGLGLVAIIMAGYLLVARPYQLQWGATQEEIVRSMPGDELDADPSFLATRAITITGTPQEIWPWLVQMGYHRAGYYGYDIIENPGSRTGLESARRIVPELQKVKVGDEVPIGAAGSWVMHAMEPDRFLIWSGEKGDSAFTWALYPLDERHTRLVSRIRFSHRWSQPGLMALDSFTEVTDHLAVRKILQGVKGRVEGTVEPTAQTNTEVAVYVGVALTFAVAVVMLLVRRFTWGRWLAGLAAGVIWLVTWYAPIPIWIAAVLLLCSLYGLWRMRPSRRRPDRLDHRQSVTSPA